MSESYPCQPPKCMPLVTKEKKIAPARNPTQSRCRTIGGEAQFAPPAQNWRLVPLPRLSHLNPRPQAMPVRLISWGTMIWHIRCERAAFESNNQGNAWPAGLWQNSVETGKDCL
jgi:hypothetical protein